ncbi:hypothetical protein [Paraburkholderia solisilvae]|uniref:Uncharacterized protein n=1 Tax=Paraburkholderia solisilvae TaxID=624376 RepID=A0A6J5D948_9BURK|nr:hypothetical protein [Paraburkholderia solisilvae]CAB3749652.1 hypothetical protein LMG29739_00856 [Paraburkholderia solisilvae]
MNKPGLPKVSAQVVNLGRSAAEASYRYADRFGDLRALAKLLQNTVERARAENDDHCAVAAIIVRLSDEYATFARAEADMFATVASLELEDDADDVCAGGGRPPSKH